MIEILQQWDWDILYAVAELRAISFLDTLMPFVSRLGDAGFIWIAAGVALLCTRRYRKVGIAGAGGWRSYRKCGAEKYHCPSAALLAAAGNAASC